MKESLKLNFDQIFNINVRNAKKIDYHILDGDINVYKLYSEYGE